MVQTIRAGSPCVFLVDAWPSQLSMTADFPKHQTLIEHATVWKHIVMGASSCSTQLLKQVRQALDEVVLRIGDEF